MKGLVFVHCDAKKAKTNNVSKYLFALPYQDAYFAFRWQRFPQRP